MAKLTKDDILALNTRDFQNRKGAYPKSYIPDSVQVQYFEDTDEYMFLTTFKNTPESDAKVWLENYIKELGLTINSALDSWQDGDYDNDWVCASCRVKA